jgi:predicted transcriptional regulator
MKLQDMMIRNVVQIAPAESIGTAAKRMSESAVGCLVVTVNDAVKGIITHSSWDGSEYSAMSWLVFRRASLRTSL